MRRRFNPLSFILFSLFLHAVLTLVLLTSFEAPKPPESKSVVVELVVPPPPPEVPKTEEKPKVQPQDQAQQIVEQDEKSLNDEKPAKDAFLSAHDQTVKKQTVAKETGEFKNQKQQSHANKPNLPPAAAKKSAQKSKPSIQDLMGQSPAESLKKKDDYEQTKVAERERANTNSGGDVSRSADYLKDIDQGAETMLNTREFKYYTYYTRIRRQLSQYWEPRVRDRLSAMFRQGRKIAADQDHITKLLITLNEAGGLVRVQVLSESGVSDLDDAATEAFRSAAPFPNPPKGIVESDGTVKIRWDFVLES